MAKKKYIKKKSYRTICYVNACDFPHKVNEYCAENDIQTHYEDSVVYIENDGNVFAKWLLSIGYKFKSDFDPIAISST